MKQSKVEKYKQKYNENITQWFYDSINYPYIEKPINIISKLATNDTIINQLYYFGKSKLGRAFQRIFDKLGIKLDKRLGLSDHTKLAIFGRKGVIEHKSVFVAYAGEMLKRYVLDWKYRQENRIKVPPPIHKRGTPPNTYKGWKKLRDEISPNFTLNLEEGEIFKVLPDDSMTPKDRIERLIEFKDVDRVGFGPTLSHTIALIGGQTVGKRIGGFWDFTFGSKCIAKMAINTWIRTGGIDFTPFGTGFGGGAIPFPETHSKFFYNWEYPGDAIVEQFVERELLKDYESLYDYGLLVYIKEFTKRMMYDMLLAAKGGAIALLGTEKYLKKVSNQFISYATSIFSLWDIIPMARGMFSFMRDTVKRPEEVKAMFEFLNKGYLEFGLMLARITRGKLVLFGNSRGSNSWVSPKMFEELYWPSMKYQLEQVIKAGYVPMCHLDNNWVENMHYFLELPKHSCVFHLDQGDLAKVREIVGDHFCLMGNLQPPLLKGGTPQQVEEEVKRLIEACGQEGGYIVATGCECTPDVSIQNLMAMKRAVKNYGYFKA